MIDLHYGRCCLESLREMPDASVHCCVTSPPYYGLRNYGVKPSVWGGDLACIHEWTDASWRANHWGKHDDDKPGAKQKTNNGALGHRGKKREAATCIKCGAWFGCLGLEPTLEMFIAHLVIVFEEVRRVLRNDGTLWLNMGDSYNSDKYGGASGGKHTKASDGTFPSAAKRERRPTPTTMKQKDLMGVPWALAFALRNTGWYLRSDIVWSKPNPMPESVDDRPTHSHEYLFLLTKSSRYFYDNIAIAEPSVTDDARRPYGSEGAWLMDGRPETMRPNGKPRGKGGKKPMRGQGHHREGENGPANREGRNMQDVGAGKTRNKRSVWTVATMPFPGAHFAVFPPALIEPCILAGTSAKGCCAACGSQWVRVVESELSFKSGSGKSGNGIAGKHGVKLQGSGETGDIRKGPVTEIQTIGWQPTCECDPADPIPCTVLDPFAGSATTCATAFHLGRNSIGLDASKQYHAIAVERCGGLFLESRTQANEAKAEVLLFNDKR